MASERYSPGVAVEQYFAVFVSDLGESPTIDWARGEVLLDWHDVELPPELTPGQYTLFVVLRDISSRRALGEAAISTPAVVR